MGAFYFIVATTLAGVIIEAIAASMGFEEVGTYDYHFANGVGAVFGTR